VVKVSGEKSPVSIDVGLKASLEVKAEIPTKSVGRTVDALIDIIRPFTEARGLKADQIRLQREDVALEIAKKARHRAEIENAVLNPVPTKMLVPFFEKASLEDLHSEMHDRWAALLLTSAREYQAQHLTFVDILSRLTVIELKLLENVCFSTIDFPQTYYPGGHIEENSNAVDASHLLLIAESADRGAERKAYERFTESCKLKYGMVLHASVVRSRRSGGLPAGRVFLYTEWGTGRNRESIEVLERERLVEIERRKFPEVDVEVAFFSVTYLGVRFVLSCAPDAAKMAARRPPPITPQPAPPGMSLQAPT
jgi:hypothetical protein